MDLVPNLENRRVKNWKFEGFIQTKTQLIIDKILTTTKFDN